MRIRGDQVDGGGFFYGVRVIGGRERTTAGGGRIRGEVVLLLARAQHRHEIEPGIGFS